MRGMDVLSCLGFKRMMWGPQGLMKLEFTQDCKKCRHDKAGHRPLTTGACTEPHIYGMQVGGMLKGE